MKGRHLPKTVIMALLLVFTGTVIWVVMPQDVIDYNSQVKPILNKHCISCHGGVKQSGGFSLLFEEEAKGATDSGTPAIIPNHPNRSEMIRRLLSDDPEERMPYEKEPLDKEEIEVLKEWIRQGANWDTHWAYLPVQKVKVPDVSVNNDQFKAWARNEIDHFIYDEARDLGLHVSERAAPPRLARRLSLDVIGLPPPNDAYGRFVDNLPEGSWETYIDELLSSPHFGEKWAGMWMDLARYSDTKGYERDDSRTIWAYRDWLICSFNDDKPYDQFLTEQIAGDLLPDPSDDQLVATAFHRNTMTNDEGGTDNEEFRVAAVVDRVNTTWEVTMGTTFACVQCHSHPYDPFTHEDYYRFLAYFNNTRDEDTYDDYPVFRHFEGDDSIKLSTLRNWLEKNVDKRRGDEIVKFVKTWQPSINSLTSDEFVNSELADTKWMVFRNHGSGRLRNVQLDGKNKLIYRYKSFLAGGVWKIRLDSIDGPLLKKVMVRDTQRKWEFDEIDFEGIPGSHDVYFTYDNPNLKDPLANGLMFDWFYFTGHFPRRDVPGYRQMKRTFWELVRANTIQTPIVLENPPGMFRETRIFERGNWLAKGEIVSPEIPEIFERHVGEIDPDRLGLAKWMVSPKNPLTARTYVNRIWEQLFGHGIVETMEDFGTQGIPPTHRELLDHLAWKFMHDFKWSTKTLVKYIVSSATYRQSSVSSAEHLRLDPQNKYYARGPRIRLTAEQVRDQVLRVSGLLSPKMHGPSVMPYQPDGIWNSPYNGRKWIHSKGEDRYRRAIYTYWKRTSPYPSMVLFDMMAREVCTSRRISTNTPLQALVTLNDSVYVEASRHFAMRMVNEGGDDVEDQIRHGYRLMMYSDIPERKMTVLLKLYNEIKNKIRIKNVAMNDDESPANDHIKAMTIVANAMLNLDEFLMKN